VNRTLPLRRPNREYRQREYLTAGAERDAAAILLAYRLRAAELTALCWAQVDLRSGRLHVNRAKGGQEALHPLRGPELRALRRLLPARSSYVFV
jgi:type 1 fimbriae regulatory protein FimE